MAEEVSRPNEWKETMVGETLFPYGETHGHRALYWLWNADDGKLVVCVWMLLDHEIREVSGVLSFKLLFLRDLLHT